MDKSKVYYLAGQMRPLPEYNFPLFEKISTLLRHDGYKIISPHQMGDPTMTRGELMTEDLLALLHLCDGVIAIEGWKPSSGASCEVAVAFATEKPVYDFHLLEHDTYVLVPSPTVSVHVPREEQYAKKIPLLGLCGYAQSGKDTTANYLMQNHGWTRVAFADALREVLYALNPIVINVWDNEERVADIVDQCGWDEAKVTHLEIRELLQRLGTEAGRQIIDENLWVGMGENKLESAGGPVVITDCRFPNEIQLIRRRKGTLVWIDRPEVGPHNSHASENSVGPKDCDYILPNSGTIPDLHVQIDEMLEDFSDGIFRDRDRVDATADPGSER